MFNFRCLNGFILLCFSVFVLNAAAQHANGLPCPKNVIIMIGDGVGYNHYAAADYYQGVTAQLQEQFPVKLAMSHYPAKAGEYEAGNPRSNYYATGYNPARAWKDTAYLKRDYTESAAAATAIATGMKTYNNSIGMSIGHDTLENLVERAKSLGKSAGVVTTVEFCHATPAGFVAHNTVRSNYSQLAAWMLLDSRCDVIMGCGNPMYDNDGVPVKGQWKNSKYVVDSIFWCQFRAGSGKEVNFMVNGKSKTVKDCDGDRKPDPWTLVQSRDEFRALQQGRTPKRVFGIPNVFETTQAARKLLNGETRDSPPYTTPLNTTVPTLAEMAVGALNVLDNNPKGFFVMIEGGATDWASHSNQKGRLIEEMNGFDEAVNKVVDWVGKNSNWNETLLIVTGDHETGLLWGANPYEPLTNQGKGNLPVMTFFSGDHTNSLIPFFATGAGSEYFRTFADEQDSVRGAYIQNAEIGQLVKLLWVK